MFDGRSGEIAAQPTAIAVVKGLLGTTASDDVAEVLEATSSVPKLLVLVEDCGTIVCARAVR
jgi:hypothetical protein